MTYVPIIHVRVCTLQLVFMNREWNSVHMGDSRTVHFRGSFAPRVLLLSLQPILIRIDMLGVVSVLMPHLIQYNQFSNFRSVILHPPLRILKSCYHI